MHGTIQFHREFNLHEEVHLIKLSTILYEDGRLLSHGIAREFHNLFS